MNADRGSHAPYRLAAEQARRNRIRDGHWEASAGHRARVMDCILSLAPQPPSRLCVLGAGNSNDLDLLRLLAAYAEVHLVDLDGEALQRGVDRQVPESQRGRLWLHGNVDLTGICDRLDSLDDPPPSDSQRLADLAVDPTSDFLPAPFDVVASTGILSQLIDMVVQSVPQSNPAFMPLLLSVRTGHLRLLARLTSPGGCGLVITDFVSSETVPELTTIDETELSAVAERLAAQRNFFHGLNPLVLPTLFDDDPVLRELVASTRHRGYWLWNQKSRIYAVLAIESVKQPQ